MSEKQCVNCPGRTDRTTAECPMRASLPVGVPDGYMPIPTAEQLADALENVRCFHDMSAELIAPELLANLLASTTVKAEQVPTPEFVWVRLLEALAGDNGCPFTASTDDYREAKPALVQLIAAGLFRDDADSLDGDIWAVAAGEQGEAAARFASCPDAYAVLSDVLNRVFDRPDEAPSLPAAGSAEEEVEVVAWRYRHSEQEKWQAGVERKSLWETEPLMTVSQHERIVAALARPAQTEQQPVAINPDPPELMIRWHESPESVHRAMWESVAIREGMTYDELLAEGVTCGFDESGNEVEMEAGADIEGMRMQGCWAFVDTLNSCIHAWAAPDTDRGLVLHMLAHEISHATGTPHPDGFQEEMRAEQFGRVAAAAYRMLLDKDRPQCTAPACGCADAYCMAWPDEAAPIAQTALSAERDRLRDEIEALRKDAERYRWLRDPCSGAEHVIYYSRGDYGRGLMSGSMLDAAIDAAMAAKEA